MIKTCVDLIDITKTKYSIIEEYDIQDGLKFVPRYNDRINMYETFNTLRDYYYFSKIDYIEVIRKTNKNVICDVKLENHDELIKCRISTSKLLHAFNVGNRYFVIE